MTIFWKATAGDYGAAANDATWPQPRVLVLQRELLPNLSLLTSLARAGLDVVGPFTRVSQARTWIESNRPDAAVLDVALWDGLAFDLAGALLRRGIPILFYTSWTDTSLIPGELREMPFQTGASGPGREVAHQGDRGRAGSRSSGGRRLRPEQRIRLHPPKGIG